MPQVLESAAVAARPLCDRDKQTFDTTFLSLSPFSFSSRFSIDPPPAAFRIHCPYTDLRATSSVRVSFRPAFSLFSAQIRVLPGHRSCCTRLLFLAARYAGTITLAAGARLHLVIQVRQARRLVGLTPFGGSPTSRHKLSLRTLLRTAPDFPPLFPRFSSRLPRFSSIFVDFPRFSSIFIDFPRFSSIFLYQGSR